MSTVKTTYPKFVAPSIAAETFGVSLQTLRRWARDGKVSYIRTPGGRFRYNVEALISVSAPAAAQASVAAPQPKKPAKAQKKPVQHQNEPGVVLQAETPAQASAPAPKPESPPVTILEAPAAMPAPKPERVTPKPPLGADALRSQFSSLAGASRW
jgi:excisionase family DNA binding protein